jgi:hypothetical protein
MTATVRARRYVLVTVAVALLLAPLCMPVHKVASVQPAPLKPQKQLPVTTPRVTAKALTPLAEVTQVGERGSYIVQAATADSRAARC